ncbi:inositol hexakisphosphate kinase 3 [Phytophthora pseudosyringae]|uniref:Kinase n=1 Tax=Phytophthora pseudosyringae TaxID=221518 RepID=A0A8T1VYF3_9STRA|nr:inositol hexakisphosphate kinase 3 [Phytophthora pseudosyringae]
MEEETIEKDKGDAATVEDAEELVGPNEVVARALDGTRFYLYNHQAGGHTAFLRSGGGSVCKPVVALELQFYEAQFPKLRPFVPQFLGKVKVELTTSTPNESPTSPSSQSSLTPPTELLPPTEPLTTPKKLRKGSFGKKRRLGTGGTSNSVAPPTSEEGYSAKLWKQERAEKSKRKGDSGVALTRGDSGSTKDYLVLGDLTRNFRRPCVLDIKMGTRQHGEDASPAKVISHTAKCAATTSLAIGLRLCGMQIYDERDGIYTIWDKAWGRQLKPDDIEPALEAYLTSGSTIRWNALEELLTKIRQLKSIMGSTTGLRCWGSSLLLIYEGDQSYGPASADVRLIDFAHCQMSSSLDTPDEGMLLGLKNIDHYLSNIASRKPETRRGRNCDTRSPKASEVVLGSP